MITTTDIKLAKQNVFEIGPVDAPRERTALLVGSCRCVPYVNYLQGQPLHLYVIEPNDYHWNEQGAPVDLEKALDEAETSERILSIIKSAGIFIHEHYENFGMF